MGNGLIHMAKDVLSIEFDFPHRLKNPREHCADDFNLFAFDQTWPNTGRGFDGGLTGQMFCSGKVYVFLPEGLEEDIHVYFDGRWAYSVPYESPKRSVFIEDVLGRQVAGVSTARTKYGAVMNQNLPFMYPKREQ